MQFLRGAADGATPLDPDEAAELIPSWVSTRGDLDEVEQANVVRAISWSRERRLKPETVLQEPFARQLHKRMFGEVWNWAGTYRRSDKNIGVHWPQIPDEVGRLIGDANYWVEHEVYGSDELAVRFHHGLVHIHLFPNGNGRHGRLHADILVEALGGQPFTWGAQYASDPPEHRRIYIAALREADQGDVQPLVVFARD